MRPLQLKVTGREKQRVLGLTLLVHETVRAEDLSTGCEQGWTVEIELSKEHVQALLDGPGGAPSGPCRLVARLALVEVDRGKQPLVPIRLEDVECEEEARA